MKILLFAFILASLQSVAQDFVTVNFDSTYYNITGMNEADIITHKNITINSKEGYKYAVYVDYFDQFRKIKSVQMKVLDKDGKVIKRFNKTQGTEIGFNASYEISDSKIFYLDPDIQDYPFSIEIESKVKLNGFISLPLWLPQQGYNIKVSNATLRLEYPKDYKMIFWTEFINTEPIILDKSIVRIYDIDELPAVDDKIRFEDFFNNQPKVYCAPASFMLEEVKGWNTSWKAFGDWFLALNNFSYELSPETKQYIDSLDHSDKPAMIRDIYKYMQDRTRYVSIQLGIGGFKSLPTEYVEEHGFGDCKALSTYVKNMLDYAGIKANYVLVNAGRKTREIKPEFTSNQFNHVFVGVPLSGDTILLECTSQTMPYDYIGSFTDDRYVLWMKPGESTLVRSRVYSHNDNVRRNETEVKVDNAGNAKVILNEFSRGVFFDDMMIFKSAPKEYIEKYNQHKFSFKDVTIKEFKYNQENRDSAKFKSTYELSINSYARPAGDRLIVPAVTMGKIDDYLKQSENGHYFEIDNGVTVIEDTKLDVPENYFLQNLPQPIELNSDFGSYLLKVINDDGQLKIRHKLVLFKHDYINDSYEQFKSFYDKVKRIERKRLVLNSKT